MSKTKKHRRQGGKATAWKLTAKAHAAYRALTAVARVKDGRSVIEESPGAVLKRAGISRGQVTTLRRQGVLVRQRRRRWTLNVALVAGGDGGAPPPRARSSRATQRSKSNTPFGKVMATLEYDLAERYATVVRIESTIAQTEVDLAKQREMLTLADAAITVAQEIRDRAIRAVGVPGE